MVAELLLLDSGPVGLLIHPRRTGEILDWAMRMQSEDRLVIPEIADYEVRRELLRLKATASVSRLDRLESAVRYAPITTPVMVLASALWASARRSGLPTAGQESLDGDVILAATALDLRSRGREVVVVTTNTRHLERFVETVGWEDLR